MIQKEHWPSFVRSILENHYDLAYRRPGQEGCVYPPAKQLISLPTADPETLRNAARNILSKLGLS